jgi:hypothetical protein
MELLGFRVSRNRKEQVSDLHLLTYIDTGETPPVESTHHYSRMERVKRWVLLFLERKPVILLTIAKFMQSNYTRFTFISK